MDPLSALREFTIRGDLEKIVRVGDDFRFGSDYSFPCSAPTAFRSKQGSLYTLETLVHYIKNHRVRHTDYIQNARAQGIAAVTFPDRKPLIDYLSGKVSNSDSIEFLVPQNPRFPDSALPAGDEYRPDDSGVGAAAAAAPAEGVSDAVDGGSAEDRGRVRARGDSEKVDVMALIRASERPLKDREALLECKGRNFLAVLNASTKREEERQRIESQQRKDGLVAKSRLMSADERGIGGFGDDSGYDPQPKAKHFKSGKIGDGVPIILVPSASQTLITMYNVKEFLEDGVFVPTDVKAKQMQGLKPDCVTVQKKFSRDRDRVVTAYEVRDKPAALKSEDWDRVVAVFVLGKEWQFKDWPFKDHVEIFNKIKGFFMRFEDDSIESAKTVKQWNVKIISISKNKRHQDRAAALEVWDRLEDFVRSRSHS